MASQHIFPLSRPLVLNHPTGGLLVFTGAKHAFGYRVFPDPVNEKMRVDLLVVDVKTGRQVHEIESFEITEAGFPTGIVTNSAALQAWDAQFEAARQLSLAKNGSVDSFRQGEKEKLGLLAEKQDVRAGTPEGPERDALDDEIRAILEQVEKAQADLKKSEEDADDARVAFANLTGTRPAEEVLVINRYSEIIGYFSGDGSITPEGIDWARNIPFLGGKLGDYLKTK